MATTSASERCSRIKDTRLLKRAQAAVLRTQGETIRQVAEILQLHMSTLVPQGRDACQNGRNHNQRNKRMEHACRQRGMGVLGSKETRHRSSWGEWNVPCNSASPVTLRVKQTRAGQESRRSTPRTLKTETQTAVISNIARIKAQGRRLQAARPAGQASCANRSLENLAPPCWFTHD